MSDVIKSVVVTDNGVTFKNFTGSGQNDALATLPDERIVLNGTPKIVIMDGSWKFGKQIQFQLITPREVKPTIEDRHDYSNYNRIEIDMPYEKGKELIKAVYKEIMEEEKNGKE